MTSENDDDRVGMYGSKKALAQGNWEKIVHGLGVISIEFQTLETVVKAAVGRIVSKEDRVLGAIVTANLSFGAAIDLLQSLSVYSDPSTRFYNVVANHAFKDILYFDTTGARMPTRGTTYSTACLEFELADFLRKLNC